MTVLTAPMHRENSRSCRYWALTLSGVKAGSASVRGLKSKQVLLDSGTSLIFTSDDDAAVLNKAGLPPCTL